MDFQYIKLRNRFRFSYNFVAAVLVIIMSACSRPESQHQKRHTADYPEVEQLSPYGKPYVMAITPYDSIDALLMGKDIEKYSKRRFKKDKLYTHGDSLRYNKVMRANRVLREEARQKGYDSCQYFDLRLLKPLGVPCIEPFVYYKVSSGRISMMMSDRLNDSVVFTLKNDVWISDKSYNLVDTCQIDCKCLRYIENLRVRRFVKERTLIVVEGGYGNSDNVNSLIVYTGKGCYVLEKSASNARQLLNSLRISNDSGCFDSCLKSMVFAVDNNDTIGVRFYRACYNDIVLEGEVLKLPYFKYDVDKYRQEYDANTMYRAADATFLPYYMFGPVMPFDKIHYLLRESAEAQFYPKMPECEANSD